MWQAIATGDLTHGGAFPNGWIDRHGGDAGCIFKYLWTEHQGRKDLLDFRRLTKKSWKLFGMFFSLLTRCLWYIVILSLLIKFRNFCLWRLNFRNLPLYIRTLASPELLWVLCADEVWWHTICIWRSRNMMLAHRFWTLCVVNKHHQCLFASAGTVRFQTRKTLKEGLDQTQGIPGDLGEIGALRPWLLLSQLKGNHHIVEGEHLERFLLLIRGCMGKKGYSRHSIP